MPESPKTTIRWDEGLKADAERCAKARGIPVAEFIRQAIAFYVAWTTAVAETAEQVRLANEKEQRNDQEAPR